MNSSKTAFTLCVLALGLAGRAEAPATQPAFTQALAPREWSFPRDHGRHDGFKVEWWYFTGNVADAAGRRFGFQLTFFRTALVARPATRPSGWAVNDLYFAHAAVSDVAGKQFLCTDRIARGRPGYAFASDRALDVRLLDWRCDVEGKDVRLVASDPSLAIDLTCAPGRGPVLQGPGGLNPKGLHPGQASYYYSMTRQPTTGTLVVKGRRFDVKGITWMDHEFSSNALAENQSGWDWMALTLTDGTDWMIYRLRDRAGGTDYLSGTRIDPAGDATLLSAADIQLTPSRPWKSPRSGGEYPQRWAVRLKGEPPLVVQTRFDDQELQTPNSTEVTYYEGTAEVRDESDRPAGEGYLEMTGYAKSLGKSF